MKKTWIWSLALMVCLAGTGCLSIAEWDAIQTCRQNPYSAACTSDRDRLQDAADENRRREIYREENQCVADGGVWRVYSDAGASRDGYCSDPWWAEMRGVPEGFGTDMDLANSDRSLAKDDSTYALVSGAFCESQAPRDLYRALAIRKDYSASESDPASVVVHTADGTATTYAVEEGRTGTWLLTLREHVGADESDLIESLHPNGDAMTVIFTSGERRAFSICDARGYWG